MELLGQLHPRRRAREPTWGHPEEEAPGPQKRRERAPPDLVWDVRQRPVGRQEPRLRPGRRGVEPAAQERRERSWAGSRRAEAQERVKRRRRGPEPGEAVPEVQVPLEELGEPAVLPRGRPSRVLAAPAPRPLAPSGRVCASPRSPAPGDVRGTDPATSGAAPGRCRRGTRGPAGSGCGPSHPKSAEPRGSPARDRRRGLCRPLSVLRAPRGGPEQKLRTGRAPVAPRASAARGPRRGTRKEDATLSGPGAFGGRRVGCEGPWSLLARLRRPHRGRVAVCHLPAARRVVEARGEGRRRPRRVGAVEDGSRPPPPHSRYRLRPARRSRPLSPPPACTPSRRGVTRLSGEDGGCRAQTWLGQSRPATEVCAGPHSARGEWGPFLRGAGG